VMMNNPAAPAMDQPKAVSQRFSRSRRCARRADLSSSLIADSPLRQKKRVIPLIFYDRMPYCTNPRMCFGLYTVIVGGAGLVYMF